MLQGTGERAGFAGPAEKMSPGQTPLAAKTTDIGLLESRNWSFFAVTMPNFWERPEISGMMRDVRFKPHKYDWLKNEPLALPAPPPSSSSLPPAAMSDPDAATLQILASLETGKSQ